MTKLQLEREQRQWCLRNYRNIILGKIVRVVDGKLVQVAYVLSMHKPLYDHPNTHPNTH